MKNDNDHKVKNAIMMNGNLIRSFSMRLSNFENFVVGFCLRPSVSDKK